MWICIHILFNEGNILVSFPKIYLKDVLYISYLNSGGFGVCT